MPMNEWGEGVISASEFPKILQFGFTESRKRSYEADSPVEQVNVTDGHKKDIITKLDKAIDVILMGRSPYDLPGSFSLLQSICMFVYMDKTWVCSIYDRITDVFDTHMLPLVKEAIESNHPLAGCCKMYTTWRQRLRELRMLLIMPDESTTLRLPNGKKIKFIPFGLDLFASRVLNSNKPKDYMARLADPSENRLRSLVLLAIKDMMYSLVSPTFESEQLKEMVAEIHNIQLELHGESKLHLFEVMKQATHQNFTSIRDQLLESPESYLPRAIEYQKIIPLYVDIFKPFLPVDFCSNDLLETLLGTSVLAANPQVVHACFGFDWNIQVSTKLIQLYADEEKSWLLSSIEEYNIKLYRSHISQHLRDKALISDIVHLYQTLSSNTIQTFGRESAIPKNIFVNAIQQIPNGPVHVCDHLLKYIETTLGKPSLQDLDRKSGSGRIYQLSDLDPQDSITTILILIPSSRRYFFEKYQIQVSRRLLRGQSFFLNRELKMEWLELERELLKKLKNMCGREYTDQLDSMVESVELSELDMPDFLDVHKHSTLGSVDMDICCVDSNCWPRVPENQPLITPSQLQPLLHEYETFYRSQHKSRKLQWKYHFHRVTLDVQFDEKKARKQTIECSLYQAAIILAFEDHASLSFDQIKSITGMTSKFVTQNLNIMTSSKFPILVRETNYRINEKFRWSKKTLRLPIQMGESSTPIELHSSEVPSRGWISSKIEAFVVRTLKAEQRMAHDKLLLQVLDHMKQQKIYEKDVVALVKGVVEKLINEDYVAREGDNYVYVP
ncbi:hypothetical protein KL911_003497 [Ogataea haglerorum]|uniref:Cullin family profile domain-containing protein n=1 Tax=Ogataea haglerorum TaxID=1937702 RepID=A0ABQ7RNS0_9ASCO|nr:uncharacterized protein KL911_003497 [Ogataea haglerorum]KAG7700127.1 hypothetical protein KL915_000816 [Ogataea haglerorum]KAG7711598.1 hypothetical protein KL914_000240 [Ogataea haglerorum]KAG7712369.1 hypothetical protein KL950_000240 [Ogataea haglerorum]KAG7752766.1 hypothetical protein KL911_003497 [Ogataea haglerorum]KAG7761354.1 hypothetical protein KL947_000302 [Ogataea haglerorum]